MAKKADVSDFPLIFEDMVEFVKDFVVQANIDILVFVFHHSQSTYKIDLLESTKNMKDKSIRKIRMISTQQLPPYNNRHRPEDWGYYHSIEFIYSHPDGPRITIDFEHHPFDIILVGNKTRQEVLVEISDLFRPVMEIYKRTINGDSD